MMAAEYSEPDDIGSRLELFVDDWLIDRLSGAQQRLQHPVPQDIALVFDRPPGKGTCAPGCPSCGPTTVCFASTTGQEGRGRRSTRDPLLYW